MSKPSTHEKLILSAIIAVAAFFRFYQLDALPPGFQFDQAFYVFDAVRLLQGQFHIFFAAPGGSEPLFIYLAMVGVALFGENAFGLKLTSAIVGVLTVALVYGFARRLFRSARIGLLSAFFTAISIWHLFYGRYGERITLAILLGILVFWFFWRAISASQEQQQRYSILTGVFLGLGNWAHMVARVFPIAIVLLTLYKMWTDRANARAYLKGLAIIALTSLAIFLPLGIYFLFHPDQFISHAAQVSIFVPHANETGNVPSALLRNTSRLLGMFFIEGDDGMIRNVPGRPVFDPFVGVLFLVGVAVWLVALFSPRSPAPDRQRAVFLATWLFVTMLVSLVSDDAPNFNRLNPAIPLVMMFPAWGASAIWERLRTPLTRRVAVTAFAIIAVVSTGLAYRDYFIVLRNDPALYYAFDVDKVEVSDWLNQNAKDHTVFLAPVWYQVGTVSLLTRNAPVKSFESRDTIVLPSKVLGKDALYAFPFEQEKKAQTLATRLGTLATREELVGSNGGKMLIVYRVAAQNLPDPENPMDVLARGGEFVQPKNVARARWQDQIELFGSTLNPEGPGRRNLTVNLFLRALEPMSANYTFSIKARDEQGRVWGQEDKWAGNNSYATTQWSVGDVIIEKFYPGLSACAPAGEYRVTVEAYNPATMQVLASSEGGDGAISLGTFRADASESNRLEDLEPEQRLDREVAPGMALLGFTLTSDQVRAGDPLSLRLFWRGRGQAPTVHRARIILHDSAGGEFPLAESTVSLPVEGRGLCTLFDLRAPANPAPGKGSILVNGIQLASVHIAP